MRKIFGPSFDADFGRVLADIQRASVDEDSSTSFANPAARAAFPLRESDDGMRGASRWEEALAWIGEQDGPGVPGNSVESIEAIAEELGLRSALTQDELNQARRLFMWRNHPDRLDEAQRGVATRRVAIANMLIDRAQARLTGARPSRS